MSTLILYIKSCSVRAFVKLYFLRLKFWRHNQDLQMTCHSIRVMQSCCSSKLFLTKRNVLQKKTHFLSFAQITWMKTYLWTMKDKYKIWELSFFIFLLIIYSLLKFELAVSKVKLKQQVFRFVLLLLVPPTLSVSLFQFAKNLLYKDESVYVCVCVCVYVRRPAAGPTQAITPKFGVGSSFHPGSAPSQGATQNVDPRGTPYSDPLWKTLKG